MAASQQNSRPVRKEVGKKGQEFERGTEETTTYTNSPGVGVQCWGGGGVGVSDAKKGFGKATVGGGTRLRKASTKKRGPRKTITEEAAHQGTTHSEHREMWLKGGEDRRRPIALMRKGW